MKLKRKSKQVITIKKQSKASLTYFSVVADKDGNELDFVSCDRRIDLKCTQMCHLWVEATNLVRSPWTK